MSSWRVDLTKSLSKEIITKVASFIRGRKDVFAFSSASRQLHVIALEHDLHYIECSLDIDDIDTEIGDALSLATEFVRRIRNIVQHGHKLRLNFSVNFLSSSQSERRFWKLATGGVNNALASGRVTDVTMEVIDEGWERFLAPVFSLPLPRIKKISLSLLVGEDFLGDYPALNAGIMGGVAPVGLGTVTLGRVLLPEESVPAFARVNSVVITGDDLSSLSNITTSFPNLKKLRLDSTTIRLPDEFDPIFNSSGVIPQFGDTLTRVRIGHCIEGTDWIRESGALAALVVTMVPNLEVLRLDSNNRLQDIQVIVDTFVSHILGQTTSKTVEYSYNGSSVGVLLRVSVPKNQEERGRKPLIDIRITGVNFPSIDIKSAVNRVSGHGPSIMRDLRRFAVVNLRLITHLDCVGSHLQHITSIGIPFTLIDALRPRVLERSLKHSALKTVCIDVCEHRQTNKNGTLWSSPVETPPAQMTPAFARGIQECEDEDLEAALALQIISTVNPNGGSVQGGRIIVPPFLTGVPVGQVTLVLEAHSGMVTVPREYLALAALRLGLIPASMEVQFELRGVLLASQSSTDV